MADKHIDIEITTSFIRSIQVQPPSREPISGEYHHYTEPVVAVSQQPINVYRTQSDPQYARPYQPVQEEHFYSAPLVEEQRIFRQHPAERLAYQQYFDQLENLKNISHQRNLDQRPSEVRASETHTYLTILDI